MSSAISMPVDIKHWSWDGKVVRPGSLVQVHLSPTDSFLHLDDGGDAKAKAFVADRNAVNAWIMGCGAVSSTFYMFVFCFARAIDIPAAHITRVVSSMTYSMTLEDFCLVYRHTGPCSSRRDLLAPVNHQRR